MILPEENRAAKIPALFELQSNEGGKIYRLCGATTHTRYDDSAPIGDAVDQSGSVPEVGESVDVVMHALYEVPRGKRAQARERMAGEAGAKWLSAQGARAGFRLTGTPIVESYSQIAIERRHGRSANIAVLDLKGGIEITDPDPFLAKLAVGFGAAKAFGNGLMLIRRA